MTHRSTLSLHSFQTQILPLLQSRHTQGHALRDSIKSFLADTTITDHQGRPLDVETLVLDSTHSPAESEFTANDDGTLGGASGDTPGGASGGGGIADLVEKALARIPRPDPRFPNAYHDTPRTPSPFSGRPNGPRFAHSSNYPTSAFRSFGDFALAVHKASHAGGRIDSRLITKSPSTFSNESTGGPGGFLVPQEFADRVWQIVFADDSLLARTNQIPTSRNSLSLPVSQATPWGSSGVQAYWVDEAAAIDQSRPNFEQRNLRLSKLAALVPVSDELIDDAPALDAFISDQAGKAIRYKADDAIVNGDGLNEPLGILNSSALVTVSKESSQAAATVNAANIAKMYARMPASNLSSAVWLIYQDVMPQLLTMTLGNQAIYLPPNGIVDAPFGTLLGRPVVLSQHCQALGSKGDVIFANLREYVTLTKASGVQVASSIHLWFDSDLTAFRFTFRVAGQPWLSAPISPANGSTTLSPFITLESR